MIFKQYINFNILGTVPENNNKTSMPAYTLF